MLRRILVLTLAVTGVLAAQDPPSRAGRISYVSGAVSFEPAGVTDWVAATVNRPLTMGDQLYADSGARAEVHVPGTAFRLGDRTAFQFMNLDDRSVQVRLSEGTLNVRIRHLYGNVEIDTPNLAFTVSRPGEYRLDASPDGAQTLVTARDDEGQVTAGGGSFTLHMGQQAVVRGQDQTAQYKISSAPGYDAFDQWVMSRNSREDRYAHPGYVSPEVVGYEDLGAYGTWRAVPDYGEVWVPNGVAAGWAPYHDGHWAWVDPWGWTWVDDAPWGFAPFHYGRWAFINGYWGWCPGPVAVAPVYAPALVAWVGFGGGFGVPIGFGGGPAVGWFPLGPRDVYIPAFAASAAFVTRINVTNTTVINTAYVNNVYGGYLRTRSIPVATYMNRTVPGAVVAVPQNAFTGARPVQQAAIRIQPSQIAGMRAADPAPRVAPQMASVLGHPAAGNVPRPPAAVLSRPIVARTAPPPPPPSFQQRQTLLAHNPGHPLAVGQLHALAGSGGAVANRPPVRVESQARPITPQVAHAGSPAKLPSASQPRPMAAQPRSPAPQAAQQHAAPPQTARTQPRSVETPKAQQHAVVRPPQQRLQPVPPPRQPQAQPPAHRAPAPLSPPRHAPPHVPATHRPVAPPPRPAHPAPPPQRAAAPPPAHHSPPPPHASPPPRAQPTLQAQHRPPAPLPHQPPPERKPEHR